MWLVCSFFLSQFSLPTCPTLLPSLSLPYTVASDLLPPSRHYVSALPTFVYVYWEGKVLLCMYPTSLYSEEG
jgi:hypothetical protein